VQALLVRSPGRHGMNADSCSKLRSALRLSVGGQPNGRRHRWPSECITWLMSGTLVSPRLRGQRSADRAVRRLRSASFRQPRLCV